MSHYFYLLQPLPSFRHPLAIIPVQSDHALSTNEQPQCLYGVWYFKRLLWASLCSDGCTAPTSSLSAIAYPMMAKLFRPLNRSWARVSYPISLPTLRRRDENSLVSMFVEQKTLNDDIGEYDKKH